MGPGEVCVRTSMVVIAVLVLATFGLGSTWAFLGRHAQPLTGPRAEQMVREAQRTANVAAREQIAQHPIPVERAGQSNTERLADLDAWFATFRSAPRPAASGDEAEQDAAAIAVVQARASTLRELTKAYQPIGNDKNPEICARARVQMAEIHLLIAEDLESLAAPAYMTPDQQAAFSVQTGTRVSDQKARARIELEVAQGLEQDIPASSDVHEHIRALEKALAI
jgi:hypothetical protein